MGDQADYSIEDGEDALFNHEQGLCVGFCQYCFEEMSEEDQQSILQNLTGDK